MKGEKLVAAAAITLLGVIAFGAFVLVFMDSLSFKPGFQ